jgi:hypothetical protein
LSWSTENLYTIGFAFVIEALGNLKQPKLLNKPRDYAHNEVWSWLNLVLLICTKMYHVNLIFVVIIPFFLVNAVRNNFFSVFFPKFFTSWLQIRTYFWNRIIRSLTSCIVQEKNVERCDKGRYYLLITSSVLWRGYLFSSLQVPQLSHRCHPSHIKPASTRNFTFFFFF